jgi:hypothetical protein
MRVASLTLTALCLAALAAAPARADGDPASDYLLGQRLFLPFNGSVPTSAAARLGGLLADSAKHGYEVRVALISSPTDLGAVTSLWRKPQQYAIFLGQELYFVYKGRLLVVMPNGFGVSQAGKPAPALRRALGGIAPPAGGGAALADAADSAVRSLAASDGVRITSAPSGGGSSNRDRITIGAAGLAAVALCAAVWLRRRGRSRTA